MSLHAEIFEQPASLERLLRTQGATVEAIAQEIRRRDIEYVFLAARGTSDNAGRYANYLWGAQNGLPLALAAPSLFTYYQQPPRLNNALVVGVSQSGQSPDIVGVIAEGRRQGCLTLAITNEPLSPLAQAADLVLDIRAGPEEAVAATKTYTAELMAVAMLSAALDGSPERWQELGRVPGWVAQSLALDDDLARMTPRYRYMQHCVVIGRGYNYATAFEWSLKLKELTYVVAEPYSSADFLHGPVAMVERDFPALVIAPSGAAQDYVRALAGALREAGAELLVLSDQAAARALGQIALPLPAGVPEWLSPVTVVVAGQLFAPHLALVKGLDPDRPRRIRKVTRTH